MFYISKILFFNLNIFIIILSFIFFNKQVLSEWVSSSGKYYIDRNISVSEACQNALVKSKNNALRKALGERITSQELEVCTDNSQKNECELYRNTFNFLDGGLITDISDEKESIIEDFPQKYCLVNLRVNIKKFTTKPDFNYTINVNLDNKSIINEGDEISINGEVNKKSYLTILGWYPNLNKDYYYKIYPNKYTKSKSFKGFFNIPDQQKNKYKIFAQLPKNFKKKEAYEFLIVIASKIKIDILEKQKIFELNKRLFELGRSNWEIRRLGYKIVRN